MGREWDFLPGFSQVEGEVGLLILFPDTDFLFRRYQPSAHLLCGAGALKMCLLPFVGLIPFLVRRILNILCLCSHPKLSRYGTAIEDSLEASSRSVLPALQAGGRYSGSQEMAGVVNVETRGAMEAGERGGGGSGG